MFKAALVEVPAVVKVAPTPVERLPALLMLTLPWKILAAVKVLLWFL